MELVSTARLALAGCWTGWEKGSRDWYTWRPALGATRTVVSLSDGIRPLQPSSVGVRDCHNGADPEDEGTGDADHQPDSHLADSELQVSDNTADSHRSADREDDAEGSDGKDSN
jgi:hypothetical protein